MQSAEVRRKETAAKILLEWINLHTRTKTSTRFYLFRSTICSHSNDEQPLLNNMGSSQEPPLDEIQWRSPQIAQSMTGIQTNTGNGPLCRQSLS